MKLKPLKTDKYTVVAVMEDEDCPVERFLTEGEESTLASRIGLLDMLEYVAQNGLSDLPHGWVHEASKRDKIYEFIRGRLRIFFFKGTNGHIAVCCGTNFKKQAKADKGEVKKAAKLRDEYFEAQRTHNLIIENEDDPE